MSSTVQSLPVELLQCIFDKLSPCDRERATLVCHQWCQVLRSDHYIRRMVLTVTNRNLCSRQMLRRMRRPFRKLNIEDGCVRRALNVVFGHQMAVLRFSRLVGIVYTPGSRLLCTKTFRRRLRAAVELVRMASRRLESLSMRFLDKAMLLDVLEIESFACLRYAGLFAVSNGKDFVKLSALDFGPAHRATLARLDSLEVRDAVNMFGDVFDVIFQGATNLVQLYVSGVDMSPSALAAIHDMKKLKRIHLYIFSLLPRGVNF
ncbi:hypothetical protein pipiens_010363 [Culex pipiens pipiens]|uniref:F-box domain-containing protein n=1 Tax=Culex pipiens pipiens TaxID=38569 RepID=A0ABD1DAI2_CULPP